MRRLILGAVLTLIIVTNVFIGGAIVIGHLFPSQWLFTVTTNPCLLVNACALIGSDVWDLVMIDGDHRFERLLAPPPQTDRMFSNISVDGQYAVYVVNYSGERRLNVYYLLRNEVAQFSLDQTNILNLAWLGNGEGFYFNTAEEVYLYDYADMALELLFTAPDEIEESLFLPDMNFILVRLENGDIYRVSLYDTDDSLQLITGTNDIALFSYSAHGKLALRREQSVLIIDVLTGEILNTIDDIDRSYAFEWSPDGHWLTVFAHAYSDDQNNVEHPQRVYNIDVATNAVYQLHVETYFSDSSRIIVTWSLDSTYLAVITTGTLSGNNSIISITDPTGDNIRIVTHDGFGYSTIWMPNRPILFFTMPSSTRNELYMVDVSADTLNPILLDGHGGSVRYTVGNEIIYIRRSLHESRLYALNIETGVGHYLSSADYSIVDYVRWDQ